MKHNNTLEILNITGNNISCNGVKALASALECNTSLTSFTLFNTNINVAGAKALADMLIKNKTLRTLNISDNMNIGNSGVMKLAQALKINNTLETLNISAINMNDVGITALEDMLKVNISLIEIISYNNIILDKSIIKVIQKLLSDNDKIKKIKKTFITIMLCQENLPLKLRLPSFTVKRIAISMYMDIHVFDEIIKKYMTLIY